MQDENNPLLCDLESGVCEIPIKSDSSVDAISSKLAKKPVKITYFTDPICSSCWGIEPQLRTLKLDYGHLFEIEYRMGGLLPDWSYNSGGISKPSDVAHHWDEVSVRYDMPIDGDVWLEDPLPSSYPPSIAFKAAQLQDEAKAILFLRTLREMVFLQKKNITKWEHLEAAARTVGLQPSALERDYHGKAKERFEEDLQTAQQYAVRGFPTLFFTNQTNQLERVYGTKAYSVYVDALVRVYPSAEKTDYDKSWIALFTHYSSLTAREFSELSGIAREESESVLDNLTASGELEKFITKNGSLWRLKREL
jgi:putative protein-disulfide isomerase